MRFKLGYSGRERRHNGGFRTIVSNNRIGYPGNNYSEDEIMVMPVGHPAVVRTPTYIYIRRNGKWIMPLVISLVIIVILVMGRRRR